MKKKWVLKEAEGRWKEDEDDEEEEDKIDRQGNWRWIVKMKREEEGKISFCDEKCIVIYLE